jgi:NAD+ kinase
MLKTAAIIARFDKRKALRIAEELAEYLTKKGLEVYMEETLKGKLKKTWEYLPIERMQTDFVVTIGGDGTILRTCVALPKPEPPILAVNMGVRGFLTEVAPEDIFTAIDKCLKGDFIIEKCTKLAITIGTRRFPDALNEVVITVDEPVRILYARIYKNDEHVLDCQADGIMIATPTGSTGYSLSAGGPVLDPSVDALILTPICSLNLPRSIVFPANSKISVEVIRPKKVLMVIDGAYRELFRTVNTRIIITCSENETRFIRFRKDFYNRLRSRLLFHGVGGKSGAT